MTSLRPVVVDAAGAALAYILSMVSDTLTIVCCFGVACLAAFGLCFGRTYIERSSHSELFLLLALSRQVLLS